MLFRSQGTGPGEFALVHNVWVDRHGRVFIGDDENDRLQIFDESGTFLEEWTHYANPSGLCIRDDVVYVADLQPFHDSRVGPGSGRVTLTTLDGKLITEWSGIDGPTKDAMIGPHDLCVDADGSIYVCEGRGHRVSKFRRL